MLIHAHTPLISTKLEVKQLLDEVEQNIVICRWREDQSFTKKANNCPASHQQITIFCENPSSIIVLSLSCKDSCKIL